MVIHRNFKPLYADDIYAQFFGHHTGEEMLALDSLLHLIAPHQRQNAIQTYNAIMSGEEKPSIKTYRNIDTEGNEFIVLTVDHIIDWQGVPAIQTTVVDLSNHVDTLKKLHASEKRYRELVDGSIQGILVHRNFEPLFCNQAYAQALGFSSEEALITNGSILPLYDPSFHEQAHRNNQALLSGQKSAIKTEAKCYRVDGSVVWLGLLSRPVTWNGECVVQVTTMDITKQHRLREQLEHRANYDGLTELINRRAMSELLEHQLRTHQALSLPLCCVLIDIDDFKSINDQHGHHIGDEVLKQFAATCRNNIRQSDHIGRWGGEEFVLLLPDTSIEQAEIIAQRLRKDVSRQTITTNNTQLRFTISMGVATLSHDDHSVIHLLSRADKALYQAKHNGKNQAVLANSTARDC
ncbi:sensor domain-containing diguanylate cyclase [Photobacterium proteolyticum]|uniref:sensor domain-containing diguanylate cyclase n=1 Tax=Photobacterium proteolyticum TaxID=1903952 RepID=UPI0009F83ED0|nr:sensor domain-containing diguanylate cyclase [Photobacterium proteolyticum]